MGVLTTAYSVPHEQIRKIKAYKKNLDFVLGLRTVKDSAWKLEDYQFDKSVYGLCEILRGDGYTHTAAILNVESFSYRRNGKYLDYEGYNIWFISPTYLNQAVYELRDATFKKLKTNGLSNKVTDYHGKLILESEYDYYVGDI